MMQRSPTACRAPFLKTGDEKMRIIISPAKKMNVDMDSFGCHSLPQFLMQTKQLYAELRSMSYEQLKRLWKCNDSIAQCNVERLQKMDLENHLTPAIFAYEGIQYRYMAPGVFTHEELDYVEEHLRILSGFYGMLRPFDGTTPYRLEMGAKLAVDGAADLYGFWGRQIAESLFEETSCVINLASKEYSRCISPYLTEKIRFITCVFGERKDGTIIEKGTLCKMARGEMVRYLAEHQASQPESMIGFDRLGYRFSEVDSDETMYIFLKEEI